MAKAEWYVIKREQFIRDFIPIFQRFHSLFPTRQREGGSYDSHASGNSLLEVIKERPE